MFEFLKNLGKRKLITIAIFAILLIGLPVIIFQVQQQQKLRQRASQLEDINLEFEEKQSSAQIFLSIPAKDYDISAIDLVFNYDSQANELISFIPSGVFEQTVASDTSIVGEVHYVGIVNEGDIILPGDRYLIGDLTFQTKGEGGPNLSLSNAFVTVVGEESPLAVRLLDKPVDSISPEAFSVTPTITQSIAIISPTPVPTSFISPCGGQCGSSTCRSYEKCSLDEEAGSICKISEVCGPTCDNVVSKYPDIAKIKDKPCEEYINCSDMAGFEKIQCSSGHLCSGACSEITIKLPPSISNIQIDPQRGIVGAKFTIDAFVTAQATMEYVKANIKFKKAVSSAPSDQDYLTLFDDGLHGDDNANDSTYANVWDSSKKGVPKEIVIEAKDKDGNISTLSRTFEIAQACKELILGFNDENEDRINIVFAGANFENSSSFVVNVIEGADIDGIYGGLFSQEPFKSNKNKFNFWYVDQIGSIKSCNPFTSFSAPGCRGAIKSIAQSCAMSNKYIIGFMHADKSDIGTIGEPKFIPGFAGGNIAYLAFSDTSIGSNIVHEFGHSFGRLDEEYATRKGTNKFEKITAPLYDLQDLPEGHNIFKGTKEACLSPKNPWYDLFGRGCGAANVIDCIDTSTPATQDMVACVPGADKEACYKEVSCFPHASDPGTFRPGFNTIMRSVEIDTKIFSRSYGPVNEREICKIIKKKTGSAGGICNEYDL